jgi:NAD(P)-dependent dehydrogenase (short-subunit alcohol dehydrogenase family)
MVFVGEEKAMTEKILQDKVAVITGGGNGIGAEISKLYGELGAKVVVNDLGVAVDGSGGTSSIAEGVVNEIKAAGGEAVANTQSVATPEGGESIIQTALDNYGKLDIVVHVAGILRDRMLFNMSIEEWDAVINVHLRGAFCVIRPAAALMRAQKSGRIISFSSGSAAGNTGQANYSAAKAGILGLTRTGARDLAKYGVTVNAIWPSAATRMTATVPEAAEQLRAQRGIRRTTGSRPTIRDPKFVASVVAYLASDEAAHISGQTFAIGGERLALISNPAPIQEVFCPGGWTIDKMRELFPQTIGTRDLWLG